MIFQIHQKIAILKVRLRNGIVEQKSRKSYIGWISKILVLHMIIIFENFIQNWQFRLKKRNFQNLGIHAMYMTIILLV